MSVGSITANQVTCLMPLQIGERISQTGFSEIFEAQGLDEEDMTLAIKIAKPDPVAKVALQNEIELAATIRSGHVLPVLSSGTIRQPGTPWNGLPYAVSPFVTGGTLRHYPVTDRESVKTALTIVQDAARGLRDIHAHGYIHADVKAANVFIDANNRGFVGDLGFAVRSGYPWSWTDPEQFIGRIFGTKGYMPPEQMTGMSLTAKSDVFSLGVAAFYALKKQFPWKRINREEGTDAFTLLEAYEAIVDDGPDKTLPRSIPLNARDILYHCLEPNYRARPSIEDLISMPVQKNTQLRALGRRVLAPLVR
jgi:serine/threonine protein kinase